MTALSERLIYGKNNIERITSCEVVQDKVHLFCEKEDGTLETIIKPNYYWMLAGNQLDPDFTRLNGNLYYNWIKIYDNALDFKEDKKKYYKRDIYVIHDAKEASMVINGFSYFKGMKAHEPSVLSWDIETSGLVHNDESKIYLISNTFRKNGKTVTRLFSIDEYESQFELLLEWCVWVQTINPSIIVGHNIFGYDFPYIKHVADMHDVRLNLGRDGSELYFNSYTSEFRKDGSQSYAYTRCFIFGREIVDTMFLSYKYDIGRKYSSYGLKTIIREEGLEIEGRQFYDAGTINENWENEEERVKIKAYAEHDADDALALFDLMIPSYFYWNQAIPKSCQSLNYSATGSQINAFLVRSYLQEFHSIPKASDPLPYEGAISFGVPGIYKNVFKVDVASLYPSIMLQYDVHDKYKDPKGNFFHMVKYFTEERLKNKKLSKETGDRYYKDLEQSQKIGINSAYGMLGARGLNFNSPKNGAFVTKVGREILSQAIEWASSQKTEYWLAKGDTSGDEVEE